MLVKLVTGMVALSLAACAVGDDGAFVVEVVEVVPVGTRAETTVNPGICDLLPDDPESVCSYACDAEAMADLIPEGVCVTFACELTNGTTVLVHGCNPGSERPEPCDGVCAASGDYPAVSP